MNMIIDIKRLKYLFKKIPSFLQQILLKDNVKLIVLKILIVWFLNVFYVNKRLIKNTRHTYTQEILILL
jgi:hypothetical protein